MEFPIKSNVWLESPNIKTEGKVIKPQILNIKPIVGRFKSTIEISNPTILTAAKRSRMRLDQYLSTLFNLAYAKEFAYRDMCQEMYGGQTEVPIPGVGRIDVLTSDRIIEVKALSKFKHSIGQVLVYSEYYPNHKPTIALTPDSKSKYDPEMIETICNKLGIDVIFL